MEPIAATAPPIPCRAEPAAAGAAGAEAFVPAAARVALLARHYAEREPRAADLDPELFAVLSERAAEDREVDVAMVDLASLRAEVGALRADGAPAAAHAARAAKLAFGSPWELAAIVPGALLAAVAAGGDAGLASQWRRIERVLGGEPVLELVPAPEEAPRREYDALEVVVGWLEGAIATAESAVRLAHAAGILTAADVGALTVGLSGERHALAALARR
jgi:hypothetical protein